MELRTSVILKNQYWHDAILSGSTAVFWRLPNSTNQELIINSEGVQTIQEIDFSELPSGFLLAPFVGENALFIEADKYFSFGLNNELIETKERHIKPTNNDFQLPYQSVQTVEKKGKIFLQATDKQVFVSAVEEAIKAIENGQFRKVVLSRTKQVVLDNRFEFLDIFDKLCLKYPTAFVSMVYLPHLEEVWIGASPETLVSQNADGTFRTMALAGTQSVINIENEAIAPSKAQWTQKEIEEQALVSRYIIDCFKKIRLREFDEDGPKTVQAGNLLHLRTDFWVDANAVNFPELISVMLKLLHPTSAVCGMPKEPALNFILEHENHAREFYSGFLGPVNIRAASHIFVNLRSMKIQHGVATLFAGCGITADSVPEKEWLETEIKCQTLGAILGGEN